LGGQGKVIEFAEAVRETVGGWFGITPATGFFRLPVCANPIADKTRSMISKRNHVLARFIPILLVGPLPLHAEFDWSDL
jgi:hypothetical protein